MYILKGIKRYNILLFILLIISFNYQAKAYAQSPQTIDTLDYLISKHPNVVLIGHPGSRNPSAGQPDPEMGFYMDVDMVGRRAVWTWAYAIDYQRPGGNIYTWDDENIYLSEDASMYYYLTKGIWLKRSMTIGQTVVSTGNLIKWYDGLESCNATKSDPDEFQITLEAYYPHMSFDNLDGKMDPILNGRVIPNITGNMGEQEVSVMRYNESSWPDAAGTMHHSFERYYMSREWGVMAAEAVVDGVVTDRSVWNKVDTSHTGTPFPYNKLCNPKFDTTTISGRIYNQVTNQPVGAGEQIESCPSVYGGTSNPVIASDGTFSFTVPKKKAFCVRGPGLSGFSSRSVNKNPLSSVTGSYEYQIAGMDCPGVNASNPSCTQSIPSTTLQKEDRGVDTGYDLVYLPNGSPTPSISPTSTPSSLPGDINHDNKVDIFDYNLLVTDFGKTGSSGFSPADLNADGKVDIFDYNILVTNFGKTQ